MAWAMVAFVVAATAAMVLMACSIGQCRRDVLKELKAAQRAAVDRARGLDAQIATTWGRCEAGRAVQEFWGMIAEAQLEAQRAAADYRALVQRQFAHDYPDAAREKRSPKPYEIAAHLLQQIERRKTKRKPKAKADGNG